MNNKREQSIHGSVLRQMAHMEEYLGKLYVLAGAGLSRPVRRDERDMNAKVRRDPNLIFEPKVQSVDA